MRDYSRPMEKYLKQKKPEKEYMEPITSRGNFKNIEFENKILPFKIYEDKINSLPAKVGFNLMTGEKVDRNNIEYLFDRFVDEDGHIRLSFRTFSESDCNKIIKMAQEHILFLKTRREANE